MITATYIKLGQIAKKHRTTFILLVWMSISPLLVSSLASYGVIRYESVLSTFTSDTWVLIGFIGCITMGLGLTPASLMALMAGYFLGFSALPGVVAAYTIASFIGFQLTRWMDRGTLINTLAELPPKQALLAQQIQQGVVDNQLGLTALARMSPVLPFTTMNVLLPLAGVSLRNYLVGGFLGMLPRAFFVLWLGYQAQEVRFLIKQEGDATTQLFLLGMVLFTLLGTGYYSKRIFKQQVQKIAVRQ